MILNDEKETFEETEEFYIRKCSQVCIDNETDCDFKECEHWINFKEDLNCDLIAIKKNGPLTLRQVGERIGVSYVRVKQIEDVALKKIRKSSTLEAEEH
jgi:hypothetical protein